MDPVFYEAGNPNITTLQQRIKKYPYFENNIILVKLAFSTPQKQKRTTDRHFAKYLSWYQKLYYEAIVMCIVLVRGMHLLRRYKNLGGRGVRRNYQ